MLTESDEQLVRESVSNGAKQLDAVIPNWYDKVDTDNLSIASMNQCMLTQCSSLEKSYAEKFLESYRKVHAQYPDLALEKSGFAIHDHLSFYSGDAMDLIDSVYTEAWIDEIEERRSSK